MFDHFIMYLLVVAENAKDFLSGFWSIAFGIAGCVLFLVLAIWFIARLISTAEKGWSTKDDALFDKAQPAVKKLATIFVVLSMSMQIVAAITPNMKQAAIIYIVPKVINSPNIQQLPENVLVFFNEGLKELTSVIKGEAKQIATEASEAVRKQAAGAIEAAGDAAKKAIGTNPSASADKGKGPSSTPEDKKE